MASKAGCLSLLTFCVASLQQSISLGTLRSQLLTDELVEGSEYALIKGSCHDIVPKLTDGSVDLVCADVPYGNKNARFSDTAFTQAEWAQLSTALWCKVKPGGHILLFCDYRQFKNLSSWLADTSVTDYQLTWQKTNKRPGGGTNVGFQPLPTQEYILVLYKTKGIQGSSKYNHETVRLLSPCSRSHEGSILTVAAPFLPWQNLGRNLGDYALPSNAEESLKPKSLYEKLIPLYSQPGDLVLDFCMYTGVCGVAAVEMGRRFIGIECDYKKEKIFERACDALSSTSQPEPMVVD